MEDKGSTNPTDGIKDNSDKVLSENKYKKFKDFYILPNICVSITDKDVLVYQVNRQETKLITAYAHSYIKEANCHNLEQLNKTLYNLVMYGVKP